VTAGRLRKVYGCLKVYFMACRDIKYGKRDIKYRKRNSSPGNGKTARAAVTLYPV